MALKLLRDHDGEVAADQVLALTVEEVSKWEGRHVNAVLLGMKDRILETCKDREQAIKILEAPADKPAEVLTDTPETVARLVEAEELLTNAAEELDRKEQEIADLKAERDVLAARVLEIEKAPKS